MTVNFVFIGAFFFFLRVVSAQKSLLTEKTSQTPNGHVVHEFTNLREANSFCKNGSMKALATDSQQKNGEIMTDQMSRTRTDGLEKLILSVAGDLLYVFVCLCKTVAHQVESNHCDLRSPPDLKSGRGTNRAQTCTPPLKGSRPIHTHFIFTKS